MNAKLNPVEVIGGVLSFVSGFFEKAQQQIESGTQFAKNIEGFFIKPESNTEAITKFKTGAGKEQMQKASEENIQIPDVILRQWLMNQNFIQEKN